MSDSQKPLSQTTPLTGPERDTEGRPLTQHSDTQWVICPWCGHQHGDGWEWAAKRTETRCDGCDNMFTVEPEYEVTYHTFVTGEEHP